MQRGIVVVQVVLHAVVMAAENQHSGRVSGELVKSSIEAA